MESDRRVLVPVGPDAPRWRTFRTERTLVVAARTVTSLVRLLDVVPEIVHDDGRVAVVFAYDPSSAFNDGVLELLRSLRCRTIPWDQLGDVAPDLLISASENIGAPEGTYPVLVLPHGVGFQKLVPDSAGFGTRLSGLVADELLRRRRAWLAVSHPDQERQLAAARPDTAGRTVLIGDPCFDRLRASTHWRQRYRSALGVRPEQRLIMVTSTWGSESLIASTPDLPHRLLSQLPVDEARVALVLHPNVWSGHGAWQIRAMQRSAMEAGLLLIDPTDGWQQTLTAADLVIGDNGSVTLYAAALDKPVLLAAFGSEAVPGTAGFALRSAAGWLDADAPLEAQVQEAEEKHRAGQFAAIGERAFAEPGVAMPRLRRLVYDLLDLAPPKEPARERGARAFGPPTAKAERLTATLVETSVQEGPDGRLRVEVRRFPASVGREGQEGEGRYWHLACDLDEPDTRLSEGASVLLHTSPAVTPDGAADLLHRTFADFPGVRVAAAAVGGLCLLRLKDQRIVAARPADGSSPDLAAAAAAVYGLLRYGVEPDGARVAVRHGRRWQELSLTLRTTPPSPVNRPGVPGRRRPGDSPASRTG
ncbi:CDP-glycerol glycerophosphotransferase family protein [Streptomyces sp. NPDC046887]|uniref:CDP-glycerol glycerophosphotransferase family protein n=1 Tax=Streptomyces sp. NPDC046887 TaxID=3155472 RepID=UPI0033EBDC88